MKGILLIALGRPEYGQMAANLAASIRFSNKTIPIHLVHTDDSISHLREEHRALFSSMALCPPEYYSVSKPKEYIRVKTCMYDLSPFDETLFLDVDMVILPYKDLEKEMDELSKCDFTMETRGWADMSKKHDAYKSFWCDVNEVQQAYNIKEGRFYNLHSEFVYFKKTEDNAVFFETVKDCYDNPKVKVRDFDNGLPDEFAFSTAMMLLGHYPHADQFVRIYWKHMDGSIGWSKEIADKFIGFSLGGHQITNEIKTKTKLHTNLYSQSLGLPYLFTIRNKKQWNKYRVKM